ncbi:MAG: VWA domain-containing protein [Planctomycetes bacterium]|nr:VWA domain-containing protein [Planctomycetota bacterium]NOG54526.1 VWA domain-containing protein [Planctomycetota bacterium]
MMLLAPWALWFATLGGAVVALYVLKIRRQQQLVPSLEFWLQLVGASPARSLFERLKRILSMLLWLIILALIVLALTNPILTLGTVKPESIVVILDNSASMQAREPDAVDGTRWTLALEALSMLTTRRPVPDEWALIEAGPTTQLRHQWSYDARRIRETADTVEPFNGHNDLPAAITLARQILTGRQRPRIVLISDGCGIDRDQVTALAKDCPLVMWDVGRSNDNLGIDRIGSRLHRRNGNHYVYVHLVSASDEAISTDLLYDIDGVTSHVEPVEIEPHGSWDKTVPFDAPDGALLRVRIDRDDALATDNVAYAVMEPITPLTIWLVSPSESAYFFEQALGSMEPLVSVDRSRSMTPEVYDSLSDQDRQTPDVIVYNNCTPETLPSAGNFLLVNSLPSDSAVARLGTLEFPTLTPMQRPHPLTQYVDLRPVRLLQAARLRVPPRTTVLATSDSGDPLVFLRETPGSRAVYLAFDILDSDMPFRNAFPVLLRNTLTFMTDSSASWVRDQYRIAEQITTRRPLPEGILEVRIAHLKDDDIINTNEPVHNGTIRLTAPNEPTALRITIGQDDVFTAVNLASTVESNMSPETNSEDPIAAMSLSGRLLGIMPWKALVGLALFLIALEWLTYQLRWSE